MIKTYIYGVPHGFDFYEKDANLNNYFKGFYISSRRGRKLMVNRQENGITIYSYLRYGLKEIERQPLHSFFGMSLVVDNYQYCPNFKVLLEWFDYLFNKLVKEQRIIKKNDSGILCYVIHKFEEVSEDVNWLKNTIPNILTKSEKADDVNVEISNYDKSFFYGNVGQIICFNNPVSEKRLFEVFHKYNWISISSEILEKEEANTSGNVTDSGVIELSYEELDEKCNKFTEKLLSIALDTSSTSIISLGETEEAVQKICINLANYLPAIDNTEEKNKFKNLESKYKSLTERITTLKSKLTGTISTDTSPQEETLYCFSCKKKKPLSQFRSLESTRCKECEEKDYEKRDVNDDYKVCKSCGQKKVRGAFRNAEIDFCDECLNKSQQETKKSILQMFKTNIPQTKGFMKIAMGLLLLVAIIIGIFFSVKKNNNIIVDNNTQNDTVQTEKKSINNNVDIQEVKRLISSYKFKDLFEYIKDKQDANQYKSLIKQSVNDYLWKIIDTSISASTQEKIERFYIDNNELLEFVDFNQSDKESWREIYSDYSIMLSILKKSKVTEMDINTGKKILSKHGNLFPADWEIRLVNIPKEDPKPVNPVNNTIYTLSYTKVDGNVTSKTIRAGKRVGYEGLLGTNVTATNNNGIILENNKQKCIITLSEKKKYTIRLDKNTVVTITATANTKTRTFNE